MGLEKFSHVWILFVFHQNGHLSYKAKVQPPRLNGAKTGVFSTRSPHRPNAIGLTLAKLEKVEGSAMLLSGIDMVHGTPVLDIKPYIADYDAPQDPGEPPGDLPSQDDQQKPTPASLLDGLPGDGDRQQPRSSLEKPECPDDGTSEGKYGTPDDTADARGTWPDPVEPAADPATGSRSHESPRAAEGPCGPDSPEEHLAEEGTAAGRRGAEDAAGLQGSSARGRPVAKGSPSRATGAARRSEVPPWVRAAPAANLAVRFTPHAEMDLGRFSPERAPDVSRTSFKFFRSAEEAKRAIEAVLSADPRSVYRRKLCQDRLFYFTIDIVHVTCWFGDDFAEVLRIKHASEAVQMTDPAESLVAVGS
nr:tRNA (adenine(37)-N6)-methyltransferase isoform X2 [Dasypus novemcinctus]